MAGSETGYSETGDSATGSVETGGPEKGRSEMARHWIDGEAYEAYIGRWSRVVAPEFLDWLAVPAQSTWLDVGCGTGALTQTILWRCDPARIDAFDLSPTFIDIADITTTDRRASFRVADACELPCAGDSFDAVVSGLMLNAVSDQRRALKEWVRAAKPGAVVAVYVWDFEGEMQMLRYFWNAALAIDPAADSDRNTSGFAVCKPDRLSETLAGAGLQDVQTRAIDAPTTFRDFTDFWTPFLRGDAPAQTYVASLSEKRRELLRAKIQASLPVAPDGSIPLTARAWAARGWKG